MRLVQGLKFKVQRLKGQKVKRLKNLFTYLPIYLLALFYFQLSTLTSLWAVHISTDDSASVEVHIRPSVDRGILISTDTSGMLDLGDVEMGVSTQTVKPATVTVLGTVTNIELEMSAQIDGGWRFDNDVGNSEEDNLQAWTLFKSTNVAAVPSASEFFTTKSTITPTTPSANFGPVRVGLVGGDTGNNDRFEDGNVNMDSMLPNTKRHWWFYFRTPPVTTTVNEQKITFILSVTGGP